MDVVLKLCSNRLIKIRIIKKEKSHMIDLLNVTDLISFLQRIRKGMNSNSGKANGNLRISCVITDDNGEKTKNPQATIINFLVNPL